LSSSAKLEELRKKFDENPRRYFAPLANEYRKAGDFDQAIFICQEYLPQQPGHMSGHIVFGQALFEAKRFPEARAVFETALSLDPENLIALRHLADISRDLGDMASARTWYERVLHADPRNEEVQAIVEGLSSAAASTAEIPAAAAPAPPAAASTARTLPDTASAPTVELSAAAVQEMLKARQAARAPVAAPEPAPEVELLSLDASPTVEIDGQSPGGQLEGLEPTSQAPMEMPAFEPLGLETNTVQGQQPDAAAGPPAPLDGLDTLPLDISLPELASPQTAPAVASEPASPADGGLLDLDSFSFGGETTAAAEVTPSAAETPVDGGHDSGMELLDLDLPPAEPAPTENVAIPTMIIETVKSVAAPVQDALEAAAPLVMDAIESTAPAMMDFIDTTIPSVIETVQEAVPAIVEAVGEAPTVIMEAVKPPPAPAMPAREPRTSQAVPIVTETMAQLYLAQGHRDEAIDIYRKLIEVRPDDAELRARLAAIESEPRAAAAAQPAKRFAGTGPSIRTILRNLFGVAGESQFNGDVAQGAPGEVGSIDLLFSSESVADALSPLAVAFDGGYVAPRGDIDAVFAGGGR
jgi:tetratricopeptide (TPR) repeat protein